MNLLKVFLSLFPPNPDKVMKKYHDFEMKQMRWCYKKRNSRFVKALANKEEWKIVQLLAKSYEKDYIKEN